MGIEPTSSAWKAEVLPLNYTRLSKYSVIRCATFIGAQKILTVINDLNCPNFFLCVSSQKTTANPVSPQQTICNLTCIQRSSCTQSVNNKSNYITAILVFTVHRRTKNLVEGVGFEPT